MIQNITLYRGYMKNSLLHLILQSFTKINKGINAYENGSLCSLDLVTGIWRIP